MSPTFFTRTLITIAIILVVIGFLFSQSNNFGLKTNTQCNLDNKTQCELNTQSEVVSVKFLQTIQLEEELKLTITLSDSLKIKQIWVQGINMYMGKTAVILENVTHISSSFTYDGLLFLGACSEPDMKWQLIIQTENTEKVTQSWFFNFETHRH
ncbi:MAG: hypothetical protein ABJH28_12100 [Paraglaciecola sp.]|uniref:hypothetical protein n=1 Tax=Paraglaciecola sp. TaxID=1920173 RepID=UPI0032640654